MADVKDPHSVIHYTIENLVRILDQREHAHSWPLNDARRGFGMTGYVVDNISDTFFKSRGDRIAKAGSAVCGGFTKIGESAIGVFNLHERRKVANAASTSCSLATPLTSASSSA